MKTIHVFVYGTLMRWQSNHSAVEHLLDRAQAATVTGFDLFDLGWFPGMKKGIGVVHGEMLTFTGDNADEALRVMDRIEGVPRLYRRVKTQVRVGDETHEAYTYLINNATRCPRIPDGKWTAKNRS